HPSSTLFPYTTLFRSLDRLFVFSLPAEDVGQPCACLQGGWIQAQRLFEQTPGFVQPPAFSHGESFRQNQRRGPWILREGLDPSRSEEHTSELQSRGHL